MLPSKRRWRTAWTILLAFLLVGPGQSGSPLGPRPAQAAGGGCEAEISQRLSAASIPLGTPVEVEIDLEPGCGGEILDRHWVLVLQPWNDDAAVASVREALDGFLDSPAFGEGRVGLVLGQADPSAVQPTAPPPPLPTAVPGDLPAVVPLTRDRSLLRKVLARFESADPGIPSHELVRKARDLYLDLADAQPEVYGRRHIIMIGHADAMLGRESTLRFEAAAAREEAIDVRWYCIGGACPAIEGFEIIDLPDAAAVASELAALRDSPPRLAIEHARVSADFSAQADYVFDSARPPADQMGRLDSNYIAWDVEDRSDPLGYRYALHPNAVGETVLLSSWVKVSGVTNTGMPVYGFSSAPLTLTIEPTPEQPSACSVQASAEAGPGQVALSASAWVTLTLVADCPSERRPIDVVLAIDRSGSMRKGSRLEDAKAAARTFVETVDLDLARVAVMALGTEAEMLADLGQDRQALLDGIEALTADGENDFAVGIDHARSMLRARRPDALPVLVLLSDGDTVFPRPEGEIDDPWLQAAFWAHLEGIRTVVVCLTETGTCHPKFQQLARPSSYFRAIPGGEALIRFYADLAEKLSVADFERLSVTHDPHPVFAYDSQGGPHDRPEIERGGRLVWQQADPFFGRSQLRYPLGAWGLGRWPVARAIEATWRDRDGGTGQATVMLPEIEVLPPEPTGPCRIDRAVLSAEPDRLRVEDSLLASTRLSLACDPSTQPLEIVLVLDHSLSMRGDRIETTRQAVESLLEIEGTEHARFGLVAFSDGILAEAPLSDDRQALITRLRQLTPDGETNIGQALNRARLLLEDARPGARRFVVLMTDGRNSVGSETVESAADALKDLAELMAICVGGSCDPVLEQVVSRQAYYFDMPDGPALISLFEQLGRAVVGDTPSELYLFDQPHAMLALEPGSEQPAPVFGPNPQFWRFGFPPSSGITVTQRLQALAGGRMPRTLWQRVEYRTMDGASGVLHLPPVPVEVIDDGRGLPTAPPLSTPTPSPTRTPGSTATPTPRPTAAMPTLWLPWLGVESPRAAPPAPGLQPLTRD